MHSGSAGSTGGSPVPLMSPWRKSFRFSGGSQAYSASSSGGDVDGGALPAEAGGGRHALRAWVRDKRGPDGALARQHSLDACSCVETQPGCTRTSREQPPALTWQPQHAQRGGDRVSRVAVLAGQAAGGEEDHRVAHADDVGAAGGRAYLARN